MHPGQGPGLSLHDLGETGGSETVTLLESEMPAHNHIFMVSNQTGDVQEPAPDRSLARPSGAFPFVPGANPQPPLVQMAFQELAPEGGSLPHNNMAPYLTLNMCIALQGVFPPRT
jgi:microcystin-dependent protein